MADIQSNFAIAITTMTIVCVVLLAVPIGLMAANSFRRRKSEVLT